MLSLGCRCSAECKDERFTFGGIHLAEHGNHIHRFLADLLDELHCLNKIAVSHSASLRLTDSVEAFLRQASYVLIDTRQRLEPRTILLLQNGSIARQTPRGGVFYVCRIPHCHVVGSSVLL